MSPNYRSFVGADDLFDVVGASQFDVLTNLGLREHHWLLDIGCGSLRAGRLFIPYLLPGHYFGIEPNRWLIEEAIIHEVGHSLIEIKRPVFNYDNNFSLSNLGRKFDFLLAQSIFTHASHSQITRCLSEASRVMHDSSVFVATFDKGQEDYSGKDWVYPGYVTYRPVTMERMIAEQGLTFKTLKLSWAFSDRHTWLAITKASNIEHLRDMAIALEQGSLEKQLEWYKERYSKLIKHPYVRLGMGASRLVRGSISGLRPRKNGKPQPDT